MPHPNWTHTCTKTGRTKRLTESRSAAGAVSAQAEFSGWSNSVVEMMGDYQRPTG